MPCQQNKWTRDELILTLSVYLKLLFERNIHSLMS